MLATAASVLVIVILEATHFPLRPAQRRVPERLILVVAIVATGFSAAHGIRRGFSSERSDSEQVTGCLATVLNVLAAAVLLCALFTSFDMP